jgi:hypothetical protein
MTAALKKDKSVRCPSSHSAKPSAMSGKGTSAWNTRKQYSWLHPVHVVALADTFALVPLLTVTIVYYKATD